MSRFLLLLLSVFLGSQFSYSQYTETINSNRPGNSQGAFSVGTGVLQLEAGATFGSDDHALLNTVTDHWGIDYALRFGFWREELEVSLKGNFLSENTDYLIGGTTETSIRRNFQANTIGVKYLLYDPYKNAEEKKPNLYSWKANQRFDWSVLIPAVSLYAGANFNLADDNPFLYPGEAKFSPKVALISQNNWGPWVFVINAIGDKIGQEYPSYAGIITLTHSFSPQFAAFGEFQTIISDLYSDELARAGLAYLFHKNFQLDASGLLNFKDTPSRWQVAMGLSYRFDMHKQDHYLDEEADPFK